MSATFQSTVLFVRDVQVSRQFYEGLLGMQVRMDFGLNVGYAGGLAIWDAEYATSETHLQQAFRQRRTLGLRQPGSVL